MFDIPSLDGSCAGTLATFVGANGAYPDAGLIGDAEGDLSGTPIGTFTNMDTDAAPAAATDSTTTVAATAVPTLTTLVTFSGLNGETPVAGLIADAAGESAAPFAGLAHAVARANHRAH